MSYNISGYKVYRTFQAITFFQLYVQEDGLHASAKIAAFDFDGCLAKTSVRM